MKSGNSVTRFQGIGFFSFQYCAIFRISGLSTAITRWQIMHFSTEGIPAKADFVAEEWQNRQSIL